MTRDQGVIDARDPFRVVITRILEAPVPAVWDAWTMPEHLTNWWGPRNYTSPGCRLELRVGGSFLFAMRAPSEEGGETSFTAGVYQDIAVHQRLTFTQWLSDSHGTPLSPAQRPPDFPDKTLTSILFNDINGLTELVISETGWTPSRMAVFAYAGMHESLDRLGPYLKALRRA